MSTREQAESDSSVPDVELGVEELQLKSSVEAILKNQRGDGAFIASPDFAQYHYCWLRDGSFTAYALDVVEEHEASGRYHEWVNRSLGDISESIDDAIATLQRGEAIDPLHMPPARFALDESTQHDDWPNFQIDGYGTWLWALGEHLSRQGKGLSPAFAPTVARVARYVAELALNPCYDVWEESGTAIHTSTLACVFGGLTAAAALLGDDTLAQRAEEVREYAYVAATLHGRFVKSSQNDGVDSSILWLSTPFRVVAHDEKLMVSTVRSIEQELTLHGGLRRYSTDVFYGSGAWPILTASLGLYYLSIGDVDRAEQQLAWIQARFDEDGRLGEQYFGESHDPEHYHQWVARWGESAKVLTWSHAMFILLVSELNKVRGALEHHEVGALGEGAPAAGGQG